MAMKRTLVADDVLTYTADDGVHGAYYPGLVTAPRVYQESINSVWNSLATPTFGLWRQPTPNAYSSSTLVALALMVTNDYPSFCARWWKLDSAEGRLLEAYSDFGVLGSGFDAVNYGQFMMSPDGSVWEYGGHPIVDGGGAVKLDPSTFLVVPSSEVTPTMLGTPGDTVRAFNIDLAAGLAFVSWNAQNQGSIDIIRLSDGSTVDRIYTPNACLGIVATGDGHLYVYDVQNWVCVYTYEGVLRGAFKNGSATLFPGGVAYGWDNELLRLLFMGGTADAVDGACTVRLEAFYPTPEEMTLTVPIPRSVPRKARTVYFLSRLVGSGGEPCAGRQVVQSGTSDGVQSTDGEGDVLGVVTPASTSAVTVTLTAEDP